MYGTPLLCDGVVVSVWCGNIDIWYGDFDIDMYTFNAVNVLYVMVISFCNILQQVQLANRGSVLL